MSTHLELKSILQGATLQLQGRGLRTSASEVVVARLTRDLHDLPRDELQNLIIQMRHEQAR